MDHDNETTNVEAPVSTVEATVETTVETPDPWLAEITDRAEAEGLYEHYPDFDPASALADPELGAILRGEKAPTLRRLYEAVHMDQIVEKRVAAAMDDAYINTVASEVERAVSTMVDTAVRETEERIFDHIRTRGHRPAENGTAGAPGIRMHPAVDRLTRRDRALLAERAGRGETVCL